MKQSVTSFFESDSKGVALAIITERKTGTDMEKMNGKHYVFQCFIRNKSHVKYMCYILLCIAI